MAAVKLEEVGEKFIQLVRERPAIYNKCNLEHGNKVMIQKYWLEICLEMVSNWDQLTEKQKSDNEKSLKNRWRNLVTCFQRELKKQKDKVGQGNTRRRRYLYFDRLLFLLPCIEQRPTKDEYTYSGLSPDTDNDDDPLTMEGVEIDLEAPKDISPNRNKRKLYEDRFVDVMDSKVIDDVDEDKFFLLSLLPSFKKMNSVQKLEVKMEFLGVIKRTTIPYNHNSNSGHGNLMPDHQSESYSQPWQDTATSPYIKENLSDYSRSVSPVEHTSPDAFRA